MTNDQALSDRLWPRPVPCRPTSSRCSSRRRCCAGRSTPLLYAGLGTLGLLVSSVPVAYALAKLRWRGRKASFLVVLVAMMLPPQVIGVPLYVMWSKLAPRRHAVAADPAELARRRVHDLPAAPVLPDDPATSTSTRPASTAAASCGCCSPSCCGWPGRRSRRSRCSPCSTRGTTSSCRCSTSARTRTTGSLSIGLAQFRNLHQVQWNLTMAATLLVMLPVIVLFFSRPEGVRRGHHADGSEGMKIAVVGAGSTYTPELVAGLAARARPARPRPAVAARHRRGPPRRRRRDGRPDARPRRATTATLARDRRPRRGRRRRRLRARPDPRRRPGGAPPRRDDPARVRLRRPGDDRRRRLREGDAHRAGVLEIAERVRERAASDAWIVDFTNPVGIVTRALLDHGHRAVGLCNVAIGFQRWIAARLRHRAGARRRRPGRPQPPDVDPLGRGGRRGHPRPRCWPTRSTTSRPRSSSRRG